MAPESLGQGAGEPPRPVGVRSYDELSHQLRLLRTWAGVPYREVHRRVVRSRRARRIAELPAYSTVRGCLQPGRIRVDAELVVDIATALLGDDPRTAEWRQACQVIDGRASDAAIVSVSVGLPDDLEGFTGRRSELARLLETFGAGAQSGDAVAGGDAGSHGTVAISVLEGMAGVGKTRLAVHAGHELLSAGRYSDLCLSVNLRGYDADLPPADPAAVLDGFLRRLDVPGSRLASLDLAHRAELFRELLAGKHALIVLDNAASVDQVRPLLPDSPTCLVLITSRRRLDGIQATHLPLDVFGQEESLDLLRRGVGKERIDADLDSAVRIADLVGHLPLALALIASRIQASPDWTLADHLDRLTERRSALRLEDGVEIALGLSYEDLDVEHRRLLRLLSLHPGRDFDVYAAAALAGAELTAVAARLADLVNAHLLQQRVPGRFELHDLVRQYAAARARDDDAVRARRAALTRLFDHYRYVAWVAASLHAPHEADRLPAVPEPDTPRPDLADRAAAVAWLDTERANLIAMAIHAATRDWPVHAGHMSLILFRYLDLAGHYHDAEIVHTLAGRVAEGHVRGRALSNLGVVLHTLGRHHASLEQYDRAAAAYRDCGDSFSEGIVRMNIGGAQLHVGRYREAVHEFQIAIDTARAGGHQVMEARGLGNLGVAHYLLGRYDEALDDYRKTVALVRKTDDKVVEHHALIQLGAVYERLGRYPEALDHLRQGLDGARTVGHRTAEADALNQLGVLYASMGEYERSLQLHEQALSASRDTGNTEIEVQVMNRMGRPLRALGRCEQATDLHRQALAMATELANQYEQAHALDGIAWCLAAAGEPVAATEHWRQALEHFSDLGTPEADEVRAALAEHARS